MPTEKPGLPTSRRTIESPAPFVDFDRGRVRGVVLFLREQTALLLLLLLVLFGAIFSDVFLTPQNLMNIAWAISVLGIVSLGQTTLLITRKFDMSVAAVIGLSGIITILTQIAVFGLIGSTVCGLACGLLLGILNGALVVLTKANPFLITLGTNAFAYAMALTITHSKTFYTTIPAFNLLGRGKLFGVLHYSVLLLVAVAIALEFVLRRTVFGRMLFIIGQNETAGRLSGLRVRLAQIVAFVLCGGTAALAGLIYTARTGSTLASAGFGMDFDSIIASVLGGTSLFGGRGGALRTIVGVMVLGVLNNLLILLNVPIEAQQIAKGMVFLIVVWADSVLRRP
jgi:ribose transport system permease protein